MSFVKNERVTHVSARDVRTNGTVIEVHDDDRTNIYYTVLLDNGREVQTIASRLRKGEYVGVGKWQRVLDPRTGCYFFFDEERSQTLWDTPEARETIFGNSGGSFNVLDTSVVSDRTSRHISPTKLGVDGGAYNNSNRTSARGLVDSSFLSDRTSRHLSPSKNVSFSTEPPSVVYFSTSDHDSEPSFSSSDQDSSDHVRLRPIAQVQPQPQQPPFQHQPNDQHLQPSLPSGSSSALMTSEDKEARAKAIANSWEFRKALASTGAASIAGNLRVLGIPVDERTVDDTKLPEMLASTLAKISLTIDASDLNLLLRHVLGGPQYHDLADRLSYGPFEQGHTKSPEKHRVRLEQVQRWNGSDESRRTGSFEQQGYIRSPERQQARMEQSSQQWIESDESSRSIRTNGFEQPPPRVVRTVSPMRVPLPGMAELSQKIPSSPPEARLSREGAGSMEMRGTSSPNLGNYSVPSSEIGRYENEDSRHQQVDLGRSTSFEDRNINRSASTNRQFGLSASSFDEPPSRIRPIQPQGRNGDDLVENYASSPDRYFSARSDTDTSSSFMSDRGRGYETALVREGEEIVSEKSPPRVLYEVRSQDAVKDTTVPIRPRPWSATLPPPKPVASPQGIKRRADLWADMPPPSRPPPSGPPAYDRYRDSSRISSTSSRVRSAGVPSSSTFIPDARYLPQEYQTRRADASLNTSTAGSGRLNDGDHLALPSTGQIRESLRTDGSASFSGNASKPLFNDQQQERVDRITSMRGRSFEADNGLQNMDRASSVLSKSSELLGRSSSPTRARVPENLSNEPTTLRSSTTHPMMPPRKVEFTDNDDEVATLRYHNVQKKEQPTQPTEFLSDQPANEDVDQPEPRISRLQDHQQINIDGDERLSDQAYHSEGDEDIEEDVRRTEALRADLSDLNSNLSQLLEHMTNATERIDATWKTQEAEVEVVRPTTEEPVPIQTAPPPSTMCGPGLCTIS